MNNKTFAIVFIAMAVLATAALVVISTAKQPTLRGVYNNFTPVNGSTTINTTSTVVFSAGTAATCRRIYNDSTSTVYCALSNTVSSTLNAGIRLSPGATSTAAGPTSLTIGCGDNDFRPERITCIAAAAALVDTAAY
jgi:hypothetical protein